MFGHGQTVGNTAAFIGVSMAWLQMLPQALAVAVTLLGGVWYCCMIADWYAARHEKRAQKLHDWFKSRRKGE